MAHFYCANHGDVRISDREYAMLQMATDIRRDAKQPYAKLWELYLARAADLEQACERVAKWRFDHA